MRKTVDFPFVGSFNDQRITNIDPERAINCFEYRDPLGKKAKSQLFTSGLIDTTLDFVGQTLGVRAQYTLLDFTYIVVGTGLYRLDNSNNLSLLGSLLNTDSGYVGINANSFQIILVDGVNGYVWDTIHNTFSVIIDPAFPGQPIDVTVLNNFAVVIDGGTPNFYLSTYDQAMEWSGDNNQVFTADDSPSNNWLILTSTANYSTGTLINFSTTGTLPSPLNDSTDYYAIYIDSTHIRVATSVANAFAGIAIVLTTNGTPTNTISTDGQLQEASIETHAGTIVACRCLKQRLFLFSEYFTEIWENAGIGFTLPFRKNTSLLIEYGCAAIGSVVSDFDLLFFIAQGRNGLGSIMMMRGTEVIPISTRALDYIFSLYYAAGNISDCRAFLVKENGLIFYRMNFTQANHTYVYNVSQSQAPIFNFAQVDPGSDANQLWHEEEVLNGDRHPSQTCACFNGINYVGDYQKPILYQLSVSEYTNNGEAIKRTRITRAQCPPGYQRIRVDRLQIDLMQGQEVPEFVANNMNLYLSISKDGGHSYGYEVMAPLGQVGQRTFRTVYRKLGVIPRGQPWVIKTEFYAPYPLAILGAAWCVEQLPE